MRRKYFIKTFGCQQNSADSERIASYLQSRGMVRAKNIKEAEHVIINTCMVRQMAEDRVYGLVNNLEKQKKQTGFPEKIILTGCIVGMAARDKTGNFLKGLKKRIPQVDEFLPIEEVGFDHAPLRTDSLHAWVPISNGCNNFCTFCVVPYTRGREVSRPYKNIISEVENLANKGYRKITLLGMNVNSYGADLVVGQNNIQVLRDIDKTYFNYKQRSTLFSDISGYKLPSGTIVKPIIVKHLGRLRIPTLFPYLLKDLVKIKKIEFIDFMSSNPWDFSDELIKVIANNKKITRKLHLPVQSGSNNVLQRMNRWYTREDYLTLVDKLRKNISEVKFSTDIIVGFCGETEDEFKETVDLVEKVGFHKAYIAMYSDRPLTAAHKAFVDNVPYEEKKRRWRILEELINKPHIRRKTRQA